jgi:hypothetical protein
MQTAIYYFILFLYYCYLPELTSDRGSSWQNGSPHGDWTIEPQDYASPMVVAHIDSPATNAGLVPSCLYRLFYRADTPDSEDQETYLDILTHETFFNAFFSQVPFSLTTGSVVIVPGSLRHVAHLPVIRVGVSISDLDAMYHLIQWIYVQDSAQFLQGLLGDGISVYAERIAKFDYRTRTRTRSPYRLHATLVETTLRIVRALPRTTETDGTLRRRLLRIDAAFQLADEIGLEDDTFWRAISAARRLIFDGCAIRLQQTSTMNQATCADILHPV